MSYPNRDGTYRASKQSKIKARRWRRRRRRGRFHAKYAQALSKRTRNDWPTTKTITRFHRFRDQKSQHYWNDEE